MPRQYFCSKCGEELVLRRKSLKNKQIIVDLLDLHTCSEDGNYIDNITDLEKPLSPTQKEMRNESLRHSSIVNEDDKVFSDFRETRIQREGLGTSTAPFNLLNQFSGGLKPQMPPPPREDNSNE
jgi:hypothetical protein